MGNRDRQAGLSLVELMVAMVLGLVLTLGVTQIYLTSSQTYRLNDGISRLQENARFAFDFMERAGREAGSQGCSGEEQTGNWVQFTDFPDLLEGLFGDQSIQGWDYGGTGLDQAYTLESPQTTGGGWVNGDGSNSLPGSLSGSVVQGSDVFVINRMDTTEVTLDGVGGGGNVGPSSVCPQGESIQSGNNIQIQGGADIGQNSIVMFDNNCQGGDIYVKTNSADDTFTKGGGSNISGGGEGAGFCTEYEGGDTVSLSEMQQVAFYVGIGAGGEPALFMERLDPGSPGAEELIEGVESMQVLYGLNAGDSANDRRRVDRYVDASAVNDWSRVISVRIGLLMRGDDNILDEAQARTFNVAGAQLTTENDRRPRIAGSTTIGFRSRLE